MIPIKLVETIFHRYWAIVLPVILVPMLIIALTRSTPTYQSSAVVWVSLPVVDSSVQLGHNNPYLTPAQNQAQVLNDLISTESFRALIALDAGLVTASSSAEDVQWAATHLEVWATTSGTNLMSIVGAASSAKESQAIVAATIDNYLERATAELQRDSTLSAEYYTQQLAIAQQSLDERKAALSEYIRQNPRAVDPTNPASLDINYRTLVEQVDGQTTLVTNLSSALQAVQLRQAAAPQTQQAAFAVQDPANLPTAPLPTSMTSKIGLPFAGVVFGLLVGIGYIYVSYRTDHTIRTAADLAEVDVALLGSVPNLSPGPWFLRNTPVGWFIRWRQRDFARKTAASISTGAPRTARSAPEVS